MAFLGGFIGKLFGTDAALEGVVNSVSKGLDALVYTDEEKAGDAAKDRTEARKMIVAWMVATQGQNLSRRVLALSIAFVWLSQIVAGQAVGIVSVFVTVPEKLTQVVGILKAGAMDMNPVITLILSFYFAAPYIEGAYKAHVAKTQDDKGA